MITIINLSSPIADFKKDFENYKEVEKIIDLNKCTDYRTKNQEVLIYNDRKILYSCCYNSYKNKRYITHIYNRNAELVYQYDIDYDA